MIWEDLVVKMMVNKNKDMMTMKDMIMESMDTNTTQDAAILTSLKRKKERPSHQLKNDGIILKYTLNINIAVVLDC